MTTRGRGSNSASCNPKELANLTSSIANVQAQTKDTSLILRAIASFSSKFAERDNLPVSMTCTFTLN